MPTLALIGALVLVPLWQLDFLTRLPGDIGDSRLNNYFLEHALHALRHDWGSLWHPQFFHPFPYVLGFSDNLLGSLPVYALIRAFTTQTDTAFQIWFIVGYVANYTACFYVLRRWRLGQLAAIVGALIFAFALPTTAHAGHVQLHYRFALPVALLFLIDFVQGRHWRSLVLSVAWTVWQFYLGVYMGFFLVLLQGAVLIVAGFIQWRRRRHEPTSEIPSLWASWRIMPRGTKVRLSAAFLVCGMLMILLFYPYWKVQSLYGFARGWRSISKMLPRPQSYVLSDVSELWRRPNASLFSSLEYRHEHQMFIGAVPILLLVIGAVTATKERWRALAVTMLGMIGLMVLVSLSINGWSLWVALYKLPLASAIRAVTRLDQALLFPCAVVAALGVQWLVSRHSRLAMMTAVVLSGLMVAEAAYVEMPTSTKQEWSDRDAALVAQMPDDLANDAVLFVAPRQGPNFADELDVMWYALRTGHPTMNGYSGNIPRGWENVYDADCLTVPDRVMWYLKFVDMREDLETYRSLMARVVPVGFTDCEPVWWDVPPVYAPAAAP